MRLLPALVFLVFFAGAAQAQTPYDSSVYSGASKTEEAIPDTAEKKPEAPLPQPKPSTGVGGNAMPSDAAGLVPQPIGNQTSGGAVAVPAALRAKAEQGDAASQFEIGQLYLRGRDATDYKQAELWLLKAGKQGYVPAEALLGDIYSRANGDYYSYTHAFGTEAILLNEEKAASWYQQAAAQGSAQAAYGLSDLCDHGWGMPNNPVEAARWRQKGDAFSAIDQKNRVTAIKQMADNGDIGAQYALAEAYFNGMGVPADLAEATHWYRKAAESGYVYAQIKLGLIESDANQPKQDYADAAKWLGKAVDAGYPDAAYWLAILYEHGRGVPLDMRKAQELYRMAAERGYAQAQYALGYLYFTGYGDFSKERSIPQNFSEAYFWMSLARLNKEVYDTLVGAAVAIAGAAQHLSAGEKKAVMDRLVAWEPKPSPPPAPPPIGPAVHVPGSH